jgi:hypothetical protein
MARSYPLGDMADASSNQTVTHRHESNLEPAVSKCFHAHHSVAPKLTEFLNHHGLGSGVESCRVVPKRAENNLGGCKQ